MTVAAAAATMPPAVASGMRMALPGAGRGKGGEFLGQFLRTAVRARGPLPIAGADEEFAVAFALFAMKLVNRHANRIIGPAGMFKRRKRER